ncbi:hypothetical protein NL676_025504 [Syzygium grande]|nr:hypothetical protein NL676_025504 [Syzygium grande]
MTGGRLPGLTQTRQPPATGYGPNQTNPPPPPPPPPHYSRPHSINHASQLERKKKLATSPNADRTTTAKLPSGNRNPKPTAKEPRIKLTWLQREGAEIDGERSGWGRRGMSISSTHPIKSFDTRRAIDIFLRDFFRRCFPSAFLDLSPSCVECKCPPDADDADLIAARAALARSAHDKDGFRTVEMEKKKDSKKRQDK